MPSMSLSLQRLLGITKSRYDHDIVNDKIPFFHKITVDTINSYDPEVMSDHDRGMIEKWFMEKCGVNIDDIVTVMQSTTVSRAQDYLGNALSSIGDRSAAWTSLVNAVKRGNVESDSYGLHVHKSDAKPVINTSSGSSLSPSDVVEILDLKSFHRSRTDGLCWNTYGMGPDAPISFTDEDVPQLFPVFHSVVDPDSTEFSISINGIIFDDDDVNNEEDISIGSPISFTVSIETDDDGDIMYTWSKSIGALIFSIPMFMGSFHMIITALNSTMRPSLRAPFEEMVGGERQRVMGWVFNSDSISYAGVESESLVELYSYNTLSPEEQESFFPPPGVDFVDSPFISLSQNSEDSNDEDEEY